MKVKIKNKTIDIEPNSKPFLAKRIISGLFDLFTFAILFFLLNLAFFNSGLSTNFYNHVEAYTKIQDTYKLESGYGEKEYVDEGNDKNIVYVDEDNDQQYIVVINKEATKESYNQYVNLLNQDSTYRDEVFASDANRYFISLLSIGISEIILYLFVPLINKQRATLGQLLTGLALFHPKTQLYARWYHVLARFLLIFLIESALIYMWMGIYTFLLIPVIQFIVILLSKDDKCLREYVTGTMLIEKISYSSI